MQRLIDIAMDTSPENTQASLKACIRLREETCVPLAQKHEHSGAVDGKLTIEVRKYVSGGELTAAKRLLSLPGPAADVVDIDTLESK